MDVHALAAEFGFAECFVFTTEPFVHYERRLQDGVLHSVGKSLVSDIRSCAPWANSALVLIYPYRPYADTIPVSGNYPSSNAAYHASYRLMQRLAEDGVRAERCYVPIRELLVRNGAGAALKNGLTYIPGYGTRYSAQTLVASLPEPEYTPAKEPIAVRCETCHACERICPSGAIGEDGYDVATCARAYMSGEPMEDWVMDAMDCMLGCELCQKVCAYNFGVEPIEIMPDAFRLEELLAGHVKPALEIVGKNLNKHGRLIQHACVIAAKQGRTDLIALIEPWLNDPREEVRVAAAYALKRLREGGLVKR